MRFRLTTPAKVLILLIVLGLVGGGIFGGLRSGLIKNDTSEKVAKIKEKIAHKVSKEDAEEYAGDDEDSVITMDKETEDTINISLDEWIGWKPILDSNGSLTTQKGSIYDDLGIQVNISVINDATQSSNALVKGDLDAAGYTINRTAFLGDKFAEAGVEIIMPYISNYSNGGDGIIVTSDIKSVNDLVGKRVGVPQFSEAHTLVVWFVNNSDLSQDQKDEIINNLIFFETPDEAAKAFFAGELDAAATWEPYITQAESMTDAHALFTTKASSGLVMDGIVFNREFAENNAEVVDKFIQGALQAADLYETDLSTIKKVMPMFSTATDDEILGQCEGAKLATWNDNKDLLNGTALTIYKDMSEVWNSIGESANGSRAESVFTDKYINDIADNFQEEETSYTEVAELTEETEEKITNADAMLQKSATVQFIKSTAKFSDSQEAKDQLNDFIKIAQVLDGSFIEVAGNTDPNPISDPDDKLNIALSKSRADTVKKYLVMQGIDPNRIITVGNGSSKPIAENDTEENRAKNRRTDVSFKMIEQ